MANEKIEEFVGKWKQESVENADAYLKRSGIGIILRNVAKVQKPIITVLINDEGEWHIFIESAFKNHDWKFKLNERFHLLTIDGRHFWATVIIDSNGKLIETQEIYPGHEKNIPSIIERFVEDGKLITIERCGDVESKRVFTRI